MEKIKAVGLRWVKRAKGRREPFWAPRPEDVKAGYRPKTRPLKHLIDYPDQMAAQCAVYQADLELWKTGHRHNNTEFDGKLGSVLTRYQEDPESPYAALRPGSLRPYSHYLPRLIQETGGMMIDEISGLDLMRWHKVWSEDGRYLAAAAMMRAIMAAAVSYGVMCRSAGCADLLVVIKETNKKLPAPKRRESVITADQVNALRASAHAKGRPTWALAYALAFETTLRLWDVCGQWVPVGTPGVSEVIDPKRGNKWFGLRWEAINENLVLRFIPSKTQGKTGKTITYPLDMAPMVMEELTHWPLKARRGPMVVSPLTRFPPTVHQFRDGWYEDRDAAGIDKKVWARDLRASGITEARAADVTLDDAAMVAGHSGTRTTSAVYDRANLEAAKRFAAARVKQREQSANTDANTDANTR